MRIRDRSGTGAAHPLTCCDAFSAPSRRNYAESINRHLDDTMWLGRAHSIGHARQHVNLLGFALSVNSVALHEHRRRRDTALAA